MFPNDGVSCEKMAQKKDNMNVLVVGELHQDLFYRTDAFGRIADAISSDVQINLESLQANTSDVKSQLRGIVMKSIGRTAKKYGGESYIKRGGNGNNSATILAKINVPTGLCTVVGRGSDWMIPEVKALGIDTSTIFKKDAPTPISTIIEDPETTKIFVAPNFKKDMNFRGIKLPDNLYRNSLIVFFTPMDKKYKHLLEVANLSGKLTAFTLELQKIDNFPDLKECVGVKSEFLFCNLNDALKVCESEIGEKIPRMEEYKVKHEGEDAKIEADYQEMKVEKVDAVLREFANIRIYTMGKYGAWLRFGPKKEPRMLHQKIIDLPVINRTGAGDTFAAGFIGKLFEKIGSEQSYKEMSDGEKEWMFKVCLLYATAASALKVSTGDAPKKSDIVELIQKQKQKGK